MNATTTLWNTLTLTDGNHDYPATDRVADLRELRATGTMRGMWVCTLSELDAYIQVNGDDTSEAGLGRDDIDWTGFDA